MFADDNNRMVYVSNDEGESYTYYSVPVDPKSLLYHPTEKNWVLGFDNINHVCGFNVVYCVINAILSVVLVMLSLVDTLFYNVFIHVCYSS